MAKLKAGIIFDNRYLILKELGAGGMGQVYHARQVEVGRDVALKMLLAGGQDDNSRTRFFREFKALSELRHPHIMTFYGMGLDDKSQPYAVCEYLEGRTLRAKLLADGPLDWEKAIGIATQICDALQHAHEKGVIHRDLKPDNIMLVDRPSRDYVKLIDFGLIRNTTADQKLTGTGQLVGSPLYMSPEQVKSVSADERSDVYALGCIIFEMLSAECLFPADEAVVALYKHSNERPTGRFAAIQIPVPQNLLDLISDMLAKNPEHRCQSAAEVLERLKKVLDAPEEIHSSSRNKRQSPVALIACLGLIALISAIAIGSKLLLQKQDRVALSNDSSLTREITEIANEYSRFQKESKNNHLLLDDAKHQRNKEKFLSRLKSLELRAKSRKDKFAVYWMESELYSLDFPRQSLKYLESCLELCRQGKPNMYAEEVGLTALASSNYERLIEVFGAEKVKEIVLTGLARQKEFRDLKAAGGNLKSILEYPIAGPPEWTGDFGHEVLSNLYLGSGEYSKAAEQALIMAQAENASFPLNSAAASSISYNLKYADCLMKLGKEDDAIKAIENTASRFNKIGEVPASKENPNQRETIARDILTHYSKVCSWFISNGKPQLAQKYSNLAEDFARHYQQENYWKRFSDLIR